MEFSPETSLARTPHFPGSSRQEGRQDPEQNIDFDGDGVPRNRLDGLMTPALCGVISESRCVLNGWNVWKGRTQRVCLVLVGLLFGCITLEVGLRGRVVYDNYRVRQAGTTIPHGKVQAGQILLFNESPRLVYDLKPNLDVEFVNVRVQTNAEGFRDSDHPLARPPQVQHRVVTLGDSYMFGWGVDYQQGFIQIAAGLLPQWEFINLARPGYNAAQEVESLKVYGLKYKPDVVIINYIGNDTELPLYIQRDPGDLSASFLLEWLLGRLSRDGLMMTPTIFLDQDKKHFKYEDDPNRVPARYRDLVGWGAVERSYQELSQLAQEHHFQVVFLCFPHVDLRALELAKKNGFVVADFTPNLLQAMRERKTTNFQNSDLSLPPPDTHPSAKFHNLGGTFLAKSLDQRFPLRTR